MLTRKIEKGFTTERKEMLKPPAWLLHDCFYVLQNYKKTTFLDLVKARIRKDLAQIKENIEKIKQWVKGKRTYEHAKSY